MVELENNSIDEEELPYLRTDDQILETTLSHKSGYQKGMGYGVEVPRGS